MTLDELQHEFNMLPLSAGHDQVVFYNPDETEGSPYYPVVDVELGKDDKGHNVVRVTL